MHKCSKLILLLLMMFLVLVSIGCQDPTALGRFRAAPVTNVILDNLGGVDEDPEPFSNARDPRVEDLQVDEREYVISSGDILDVSIMDLFQSGVEWVGRKQVSETGRITLPEIGSVQATGLTELELTDAIEDKLSPQIIKDPTVSVVVAGSTEKVYSVAGSVPGAGTYQLTKQDLRVLEALAQAGGAPPSGVDYLYVIRRMSVDETDLVDESEAQDSSGGSSVSQEPLPAVGLPPVPTDDKADADKLSVPAEEPMPAEDEQKLLPVEPSQPKQETHKELTPEEELLESISPEMIVISPVEMAGIGDSEVNDSGVSDSDAGADGSSAADILEKTDIQGALPVTDETIGQQSGKSMKVIREGNAFRIVSVEGSRIDTKPAGVVPAAPVLPESPRLPSEPAAEDEYAEETFAPALRQEVIRISLKELSNGDLNQNIVVRPGDYISVPFNSTGVYYVMGQVPRPGAYSLSGERQTLKMALANVAGLTSMASADRCDITRRIGENREVTYRVNLNSLFEGTQPDIFLKSNDIINVGTHPLARWDAVIRQSFRTTYGFGFVYDRNLADKDMGH